MASYQSPPTDGFAHIPDWGLRLVPALRALWLTDAFVLFSAGIVLLYLLLLDSRPLAHVLRIGHTISAAYLLRSLSMLVTSLPDPRPDCIRVRANFFTTFVLHRCGDCVFSGHASLLTIFFLYAWTVRSRQDGPDGPKTRPSLRLFRAMSSVSLLGGSWAILANRAHYTVDLVVAIYTCATLWFVQAHVSQQLEARSPFYRAAVAGSHRPLFEF